MGIFERIGLMISLVLASIAIYGGPTITVISNPIEEQHLKLVKQVKSEPDSPSHEEITDMLERYIESHHEKTVSRAKLLKYVEWVNKYIEGSDVDPLWILAMMWQESRLLEKSTSSHGAIGLLQILPSTAKIFGVNSHALYKPEVNIKTSIKYMEYLLNKYDRNVRTATIAYNQGEGNVDKGKARPWYYNQVKKHHNQMVQMLEQVQASQ